MKLTLLDLLGKGTAKQAGQHLQMNPAYKDYVIETQSSGSEPLPYAQWMQQMQMRQMQQMQMPKSLY